MYPVITIFERSFSTYGVMALFGVIASISYGAIQIHKTKMNMQDYYLMIAYGFIGLLIGAKLFYQIPHLSDILNYQKIIFSSLESTAQYFLSGFVFYGGLIGLILGVIIYGREFKVQVSQYIKILIPAIPLFHFFGRIGCYLAGCCYGVETSLTFILPFIDSQGITRIPTQLIEAALNLILFFLLLLYPKKKRAPSSSIVVYLIFYSTARFILEFFRGDMARGFFILSTSQWISIILFVLGVWICKNKDLFWSKIDTLCNLTTKNKIID